MSGLLVAMSISAIVVVPLALEILNLGFRRQAHIDAADVGKLVGMTCGPAS